MTGSEKILPPEWKWKYSQVIPTTRKMAVDYTQLIKNLKLKFIELHVSQEGEKAYVYFLLYTLLVWDIASKAFEILIFLKQNEIFF